MNLNPKQTGIWRLLVPLLSLVFMSVAGSLAADVVLDPPRTVRIPLRDGSATELEVRKLDREGLHGLESMVAWIQVPLPRVRELWLRFLDRRLAQDWLDAAWVVLIHPERTPADERTASRWLREAQKRWPQGEEAIAALRREVEQRLHQRRMKQAAAGEAELVSWPASPWPPSTAEEEAQRQQRLDQSLSIRAEQFTGSQDLTSALPSIRSQHAIVQSVRPQSDLLSIGLVADEVVRDLNTTFGVAADYRLFAPRLAILIVPPDSDAVAAGVRLEFAGRDAGDLMMVVRKDQAAPPWTMLRHELVHAWMHRYQSPVRPPTWFNEGLAHAVAWWRVPVGQQTWRSTAVAALRSPGTVDQLLDHASGPLDPDLIAAASLLVRRLLEERREEVSRWLDEIKRGSPSEAAWERAFGESLDETLRRPLAYWQVND